MSNTIQVETYQEMKEVKKELLKEIKYKDNVSIAVKVYDSFEERADGQTYDVEINYYVDGDYLGGFVNQTFYGRHRDDFEAEKKAITRAMTVLKSVKGWFEYTDVVVDTEIEVYHV
jgi:hypothetical protein